MEAMAFQLAIDRVKSSHGASSQRTMGAAIIWLSRSCALSPEMSLEVQLKGTA